MYSANFMELEILLNFFGDKNMSLEDIKVVTKTNCNLIPTSKGCISARASGKHVNCPGLADSSCKSNNLRDGKRGQDALAKANAELQK